VGSGVVSLVPLETPAASGSRLVRIPFDPADPFHYYTVEYRKRTGWSAGIPGDVVLVHEVRDGTPYLQRKLDGTRALVQSFSANGVTVTVGATGGITANVTITSDIIERCLMGYVWREAGPGDKVCVTGSVRTRAWADNAVAPSRWVDGPYGPHTCVDGYVWREAFPGDDVCVTGDVRTQARNDNAAAASRVERLGG
jgi:hypothetical protein